MWDFWYIEVFLNKPIFNLLVTCLVYSYKMSIKDVMWLFDLSLDSSKGYECIRRKVLPEEFLERIFCIPWENKLGQFMFYLHIEIISIHAFDLLDSIHTCCGGLYQPESLEPSSCYSCFNGKGNCIILKVRAVSIV